MEMQNKQEYEVVAGQVVTAQPVTANNNNVYGTPVIIPTVNTAGVQYGQPYAAQPYAPYPQQGNIVMNPYNGNQTSYATPANTQRMQRPTQRWLDNICDWPKNIFPSCWCACCCMHGMYLVAQMSEKTGFWSFNNVLTYYVAIWILAIILQAILGGSFIIWMPAIASSFFAISLRLHIVRRDNISECGNDPCANATGECCCGFWCWYCSVAQMGRHIYGYTKVLDGDSDPFRPDNYA